MAAGNINRAEDVKKLIYAGCAKVVLNFAKDSNVELLGEVSDVLEGEDAGLHFFFGGI